jgi:outer membrane protein, heavy metal efflux system
VDEDQLPPRFPNPEKPHQDPSPQLDQISMQYPETRLLGLQLKQVEFDQSLAKNQLLPKLDLGIAYAKDFGVNPGTTYIQPTQYPTELRAYLVFELPLLLRTPRGRLNAVHAQQEKLSLIRDLTRDRIKTQIMDLSQSITAALNRIHYTHQEVELSQKLEEAERKRFLHGDSSLLIINIREQTTRDAMNKEIDALSDYFKSKAEYETFIQPPQENPLVTQGS